MTNADLMQKTMERQSSGYFWHLGVIGHPIAHSLSPVIQKEAMKMTGKNGDYKVFDVLPDELEAFFDWARSNLDGFNVTVPHKEQAARWVDELSKRAAQCGSVNTVVVRPDGSLFGDSTDGIGFDFALAHALNFSLKQADVCFIGAGGAARALAFYAASVSCKHIQIINRTEAHAVKLADDLRKSFPDLKVSVLKMDDCFGNPRRPVQTELIVQCTSLGLHDGDPSPLPAECLPRERFAFELNYRNTSFLDECRNASMKIDATAALQMLVAQGAEAFSLWTGKRPDPLHMFQAIKAL